MAGILEEVVQLQQRRSHGEYALGGGTAPQTVAELEEALAGAERTDINASSKEAFLAEAREHRQMAMLVERGAYIGHVYKDGGKVYADTAFLNSISGVLPGFELKHLGFGEFYLQGPGGVSIEFDRMRGKDFPGQSGRSHQVYSSGGDKNIVEKLVKAAVKAGKAEIVKKLKVPTPKQMAKKTGMKVRAKRHGKLQNDIYELLMDLRDKHGDRYWVTTRDITDNFKQFYGVDLEKLDKSLEAMVKSKLLDKRKDQFHGVQYRLSEWAPARPIAPHEPDETELPANDQAILNALSEANGGTLAAPKIAEVTGLDKAVVRHQLALMAQANMVSRIAPNADVWRVTHFGEACASKKKGKLAPKSEKPKRVAPAKVEGVIDEAVRPGQYFVIIDTSVPGGKMIDRKLYRGTKEPDKIAAKLMKQGRQVQVIDAAWYNPARAIMKAQGMVGEARMPSREETPGLPKSDQEAKLRIKNILRIVAKDVDKKALAREDWIGNFLSSELLTATKAWKKGAYNGKSAEEIDKMLARQVVNFFEHAMVGDRAPLEEAKGGEGSYKAQGPLEKMVGEMVRGQSGKWLSKGQMKAIVKVLNKKGITKPSKESYDDIARIVGKTLSALMKGESTRPFDEGREPLGGKVMGFPVAAIGHGINIGPTTTRAEILRDIKANLKQRRAVALGRWIMTPPGRVFKLPEKYRGSMTFPANVDEYEVAIYGPENFHKAWLADW